MELTHSRDSHSLHLWEFFKKINMAKHIGAEQSCGTVDALYIGIKGAVKNLSSGKPIMAIRFTANGCNLSSDLQKYWPIRFSFLYTARCLIGTKLELKRQIYRVTRHFAVLSWIFPMVRLIFFLKMRNLIMRVPSLSTASMNDSMVLF